MKSKYISYYTVCFILLCLFTAKTNAQTNEKVFCFIGIEGEVITLNSNEIEIVDSFGFRITDSNKVEQLQDFEVRFIDFFLTDTEILEVSLFNIFASYEPPPLHILVVFNGKILHTNSLVVSCSEELLQKIKGKLHN